VVKVTHSLKNRTQSPSEIQNVFGSRWNRKETLQTINKQKNSGLYFDRILVLALINKDISTIF